MRAIKFRGKKQGSSIWVYGDLKHDKGISSTGLYDRVTVAGYPVEDNTVGQFTGLLDKNGVGIYEGDIIKTDQNRILGVIKWDAHRLCFLCEWTNMPTAGDIEYLVNNCGLEVIGSVHDNPELLKGGPNEK